MKSLRVSLTFLTLFFVGVPTLRAQDLSKYRVFSLGTSLTTVLKHTDERPEEIKLINARPALIQGGGRRALPARRTGPIPSNKFTFRSATPNSTRSR